LRATTATKNYKLPDGADRWPIQAKQVSRINIEKLRQLETATDKTFQDCDYAIGWITDPTRYAAVPVRRAAGTPYTTLKSEHVKSIESIGVFEKIDPSQVRGHVRVFSVAEPAKCRFRAIKEPRDINDVLGRDTLMTTDMATKADIRQLVHKGNYFVQFDYSQYYDQFALHRDISLRQCFRKGRQFYRQVTAAMGQRQMVEVAHTATRKISDFLGRKCETKAIIDNVVFVGKTAQECVDDGDKFVERSRQVGATLNDAGISVKDNVQQEGDWGGVHLDFVNKTVRLTEKIVTKTKLSMSRASSWSYRNLAAHFGLLFWAIGLVDVNPGDYFTALQFYAGACREFSMAEQAGIDTDRFWDTEAIVPRRIMEVIEAWTAAVLKNEPVRVKPERVGAADWLVAVDSCRFGYGYMAVETSSGELRYHGQRWSEQFRRQHGDKLGRSVFTEPQGVIESFIHLFAYTGEHRNVRVWTDNVATMAAGNKGFNARSFDINECTRRLRRMFPPDLYTISFAHIAGKENVVADALSRGVAVDTHVIEGAAATLAQLEGLQLEAE